MFREVLRLELRQQLGRPVAWLVFPVFAAPGVVEMTGSDVHALGAQDGVARNAPIVIANAVAMFGVLATLAAGASDQPHHSSSRRKPGPSDFGATY